MKKAFLSLIAGAMALVAIPAIAQQLNYSEVVQTKTVTVATQAGAYTGGNCLAAAQTIPGAIRPGGTGGTYIASVAVVDPARQTAANNAMTLWIFNSAPTGTYTQGSACSVAAADAGAFMGAITIAAGNCVQNAAATSVCSLVLAQRLPVWGIPIPNTGGTQNIWFVPVITATPTYTSANLTFTFGLNPN